jgi:hypothetical protein
MSGVPREEALERLRGLRRRRRLEGAHRALSSVAVAQVLFVAFAVGHGQGPLRLTSAEFLSGLAIATAAGLARAWLTRRRAVESGARFAAQLREGRHPRRLLLFRDHLVLGREDILLDCLESVRSEGARLLLRYVDPRFDGPVLRELGGEPAEVERAGQLLAYWGRPERGGAEGGTEPSP